MKKLILLSILLIVGCGIFEAEGRLLTAFTQWHKYNNTWKLDREKQENKSKLKPWTWFGNDPLPKITTPMVFWEGLHGLVDGSGANLVPLDPETQPLQYYQATMGLFLLDAVEPTDTTEGYQKNLEIQKDIHNRWVKEERETAGSNFKENYPGYFFAEVYKLMDAKHKEMLGMT